METPVSTMMALFIAVIVVGIFLVGAAAIAGKFPIINDLFAKLFNQTATEPEMDLAINSTKALVCAVNSVSQGSLWKGDDCNKYYTESETPGYVTLGEEKIMVRCSGDPLECNVINFQLWQDVSKAKEWIKGFGSPMFLVYYQSLPVGVDKAWSDESLLLEDARDLVFAWWGVGKILKVGKTFVSAASKKIANKIGSKVSIAGKNIFDAFKKKASTKITALDVVVRREIIKQQVLAGPPATKMAAESVGKQMYEALAAGHGKLAKKYLTLDAIDLFVSQFESISGQYEHFDDSIVLKSPYEDPIPFKLNKENEPVILENPNSEFYMVSPCDSNLLVSKKIVKCNEFTYDFDTGFYRCNDPSDPEDYKPGGIKEEEKCYPEMLDTKEMMAMFPDDNDAAKWLLEDESPDKFKGFFSNTSDTITVKDPVYGSEFTFGITEVEKIYNHPNLKTPIKYLERVATMKTFVFVKEDGTRIEFNMSRVTPNIGPWVQDPNDPNKYFRDPTRNPDKEGLMLLFDKYDCTFHRSNRYEDIVKRSPPPLEEEEKITCDVEPLDTLTQNPIRITDDFRKTCDFCDELEEYLKDKFVKLSFEQLRTEIVTEDEDGNVESKNITSRNIMTKYNLGKDYIINVLDRNNNDVFELATIDNTNIWKETFAIFDQTPKLMLSDDDEDGVMDFVNLDSCKMVAEVVKFDWNPSGGEPNFCVRKVSTLRRIIRYAPEIGTAIGGLIGSLGSLFSGSLTVLGGMKAGNVVGASIFTAYVAWEKKDGSTMIWPGKEHG